MAARLKVFVTSDGLTDYVVAATSRPKALAAWGVRQDIFKSGEAHETDNPQLAAEALARPGEVIHRPAGARGKLAGAQPARPRKPPGPPKRLLNRIRDLEADLAALEEEVARADARFEAARRKLEAEAAARRERNGERRSELEADLQAAKAELGGYGAGASRATMG